MPSPMLRTRPIDACRRPCSEEDWDTKRVGSGKGGEEVHREQLRELQEERRMRELGEKRRGVERRGEKEGR